METGFLICAKLLEPSFRNFRNELIRLFVSGHKVRLSVDPLFSWATIL